MLLGALAGMMILEPAAWGWFVWRPDAGEALNPFVGLIMLSLMLIGGAVLTWIWPKPSGVMMGLAGVILFIFALLIVAEQAGAGEFRFSFEQRLALILAGMGVGAGTLAYYSGE